MAQWPQMRVGQGFDVHALVPGRRLIIGGVAIGHTAGLLGHSDADVLLHAVTDALLGAAGLGDIGRHFPDDDPRYASADSRALLREAARRVRQAGFAVANVDATVIAQAPRENETFKDPGGCRRAGRSRRLHFRPAAYPYD